MLKLFYPGHLGIELVILNTALLDASQGVSFEKDNYVVISKVYVSKTICFQAFKGIFALRRKCDIYYQRHNH